jgi:hypothetical protein
MCAGIRVLSRGGENGRVQQIIAIHSLFECLRITMQSKPNRSVLPKRRPLSQNAISPVSPSPAYLAICPYLDRCTYTLITEGCASCRFNSTGFDPDSHLPNPVASLHLIAIHLPEAAR